MSYKNMAVIDRLDVHFSIFCSANCRGKYVILQIGLKYVKICEMEMKISNYWKQKTLANLTKRIIKNKQKGQGDL